MIVENEFTVEAELETVWRELLDMEGVATCLPGATITATEQENVYDGSMRLRLGPMRVEYRGTAKLSGVDADNHTAVISLSAREARGQGTAMATIRNRLESTATGTRVRAETELHLTGPQAQFGRGVIEDVGRRVLDDFARRLEQRISGNAAGSGTDAVGDNVETATATRSPSTLPPPAAAPAELDVGSLLSRTPAVRVGAALALAVIALVLLRRRR